MMEQEEHENEDRIEEHEEQGKKENAQSIMIMGNMMRSTAKEEA